MSMEIMYVRAYVHLYIYVRDFRPPDCACAKVVGILLILLVFKNQLVLQLLVPGAGYVPNTARKRPSGETGTMQAGPRKAS